MLQHLKKHIAAITIAGVVLGGGAVAYAADQPARPRVGKDPAAAKPGAGGANKLAGRGGMLSRVVHGDLVVRTKNGFENVTYDRGTVTAAGNGSITLHHPDGKDVTVNLTDSTKYKGVSGADQILTNRPAIVVSKDGNALVVAQRKRKNASGQENLPNNGNNDDGLGVS